MAETTEQKAHRYLTEGRITVQEVRTDYTLVHAYGSEPGDPYYVKRRGTTWTCDCPARVPECSHVIAAALVTPKGQSSDSGNDPFAGSNDPDIDKLLEGL